MVSFSQIISDRIQSLGLKIYGASQLLAAEADIDPKTAHARITRFTQRTPESVVQFQELVEALGGKVTITWKD